MLEGGGAYLKIPGCDVKFSQRTFKDTLYSNPELYQAFIKTCFDFLTNSMMEEYLRIKAEEEKKIINTSPYEAILAQLNK